MIYLKYLLYVIRHKWFVTQECFKRGLYWQGIVHDLSKFRLSEFIPYARHFKGKIQTGRDNTGYYKPTDTGDPAFDAAWFLHQKRNPHHWQYWIMPLDQIGYKVLPIPKKYLIEMVCDWYGAGKAQGTPDVTVWYAKNQDKLQLHPISRADVEYLLKK
jgi:hypothetical protein